MRSAAVTAALAVGAGGFTVTTLPRPPFPEPATNVPAAHRLVLVASRYRAPTLPDDTGVALRGIPRSFRGARHISTIPQAGRLFALYGKDSASARYLLAFDLRHRFLYGYDFRSYVWPPQIRPGEREFVYEQVVWAREADGVLYVENAHWTYARSSYGLNGYITAIDLRTKKRIWRSRALVANARTFVLAGDYLVAGYGFSAEPDYLYLLDRRTGRVLERLALPSMPERIVRRGDLLHVRTYDHVVVVRLRQD